MIKLNYNKPEIEIIEMESEGVIANSFGEPQISDEEHGGGLTRSRRRFWNED